MQRALQVTLLMLAWLAGCGGNLAPGSQPSDAGVDATGGSSGGSTDSGSSTQDAGVNPCHGGGTLCAGTCCAGVCTGARCLVTLATGFGPGGPIAVDSTSVYFSVPSTTRKPVPPPAAGSVMKVPVDGGAVVTLASGRQGLSAALAVDGPSLYWGEVAGLMQLPVGGGAPNLMAPGLAIDAGPGTTGLRVDDIAVGAAGVYTSTGVSIGPDAGASYSIVVVPVDGGAPWPLGWDPLLPGSLVLNATDAYWLGVWNPMYPEFDVFVAGAPLAGGAVTWITGAPFYPGAVAADAMNLYIAQNQPDAGPLFMQPTDGGEPVTVGTCGAGGIATDATSVYWIDSFDGSVVAMPLGGGTVVTLVTGPEGSNALGGGALAVDATSLYWIGTSSGTGVVMKLTPK